MASARLSTWMSDHWDLLSEKKIVELTFPGSHNAGNHEGAFSLDTLCESDYRYQEYLEDPSSEDVTPLSKVEFDALFIPWQVNHDEPISQQLTEHGVRFFHLKICNLGSPGSSVMDLSRVVHQHRGYTTTESLSQTLDDMLAFLEVCTRETIVLGFNNLHNSVHGGFLDDDIIALSQALVGKLGSDKLITKDDFFSETLGKLNDNGRQIAVFMQGSAEVVERFPGGIIPSLDTFAEHWDDAMKSGDLEAASSWLVKDLETEASKRTKFYVMQANPNDLETKMYAKLNAREEPHSLREFLKPFLQGLGALVNDVVSNTPQIRINAISTDFLSTSRPIEIAFRLMGLSLERLACRTAAADQQGEARADALISASSSDSSKRRRIGIH